MRMIVFGLRVLYSVVFAVLFCGLMVVALPLFLLFALAGGAASKLISPAAGRVVNVWPSYALMDLWFLLVMYPMGMPVLVYGMREAKRRRPCVFVANHQSYLDTLVIKLATPSPFMPLGKIEQTATPVLGLIYRYTVVLVDRSSEASRKASTERMRSVLGQGFSLMIFPEGTMNRTEWLIKPMYDGAFRLAIEAQVPIVPMVATNNRNIWPRGKWVLKPGRCEVWYAPAIETTGLTLDDAPALRDRTYTAMFELMKSKAPAGTVGLDRGMPPELSASKVKGISEPTV
jgi:1-acyl-sn-glycerol-3-phosphate acyltransferase